MEESSMKREAMPRLLDLIPDEKEWSLRGGAPGQARSKNTGFGSDEDEKLELKLGLPGLVEEEPAASSRENNRVHQESPALSLGYPPRHSTTITTTTTGAKRGFLDTVEAKAQGYEKEQKQQARAAACGKELAVEENTAAPPATPARNIGNRPQARGRGAAAPVVGWPPIRSFRRNLASTSASKQPPEPQIGEANAKAVLDCKKSPLVKINMDGIPIGRKVDLAACDSYERLSLAVKDLFHGFLQVQRDPSKVERTQQGADENIFSRLLDGSGEYTLVYEDSEGDRMLVGDVPWNVFVSTAKRLRVLRSSELSHGLIGATPERTAHG
ncbi:auxin-responsive protein IAA6-like [Triticum dicoccoides]|uniref:auxin-responsive protein IAA6-like n=1 Tax=Triticum dicoccoides TaxID=85692 RepID=UPI000E7CCE79|nr:auxin-responsive protein IAA6-like [Triticum dicoccoides]XP_037413916.1 auxin-responsive protein IAA6-like [Triticum dicoccoides]XP_037413917.1 auxin-responsive protein IAA6-like [Triticum dicoccoides]XP_037413919.1 auxin-responsive protein IAA6-like [Triticum dicoccoides]